MEINNMKSKRICFLIFCLCMIGSLGAFNHDYSQTWVTKMFLSKPDPKGGCQVNMTFEQALEAIRVTDNLSLGIPKIIYLVGWQYNGHDDKYPAFFDANPLLKRSADRTALESLRWLIREARKYHTIVSLHINMTDAYDDSPLWNEYVAKDLISKNADGSLMVIGEYNNRKAYQINYQREWEAGYTQKRIDSLLSLIPELKEAGTIHSDAWIARPSAGHHETEICEAMYQQKAALYWKSKGIDITSEWVMDYMIGYVPYAWHFNGFTQADYLKYPAHVYTGTGLNPDIKTSDHALGFLFGTSCYGEPIWQGADYKGWEKALVKDFMLKVPQYFFLNRLDRDSVSGSGNDRIAWYSDGVSVSLKDSVVRQYDRILRRKNTVFMPAVWRSDRGMIAYSEAGGEEVADVPFHWGNTSKAKIYRITSDGLVYEKEVTVRKGCLKIKMDQETPYYIVPETGTTKGR